MNRKDVERRLRAYLDTPEPFAAALRVTQPNAVIGTRGNPRRCPIVWFIRDHFNPDGVYVDAEGVWVMIDKNFFIFNFPWICEFVRRIDAGQYDRVTASEALAVLEEIASNT